MTPKHFDTSLPKSNPPNPLTTQSFCILKMSNFEAWSRVPAEIRKTIDEGIGVLLIDTIENTAFQRNYETPKIPMCQGKAISLSIPNENDQALVAD